jgi:hypothetical protein
LKGLPLAAAAAVPAVTAVATTEAAPTPPTIHELGKQIAHLLADLPANSFDKVVITADGITLDYSPIVGRPLNRINKLIAAHARASQRFEESCPAADEKDHRYGGKAAERRRDRLDRAERAALRALLLEPMPDAASAHAKAAHLLKHNGWTVFFGQDDIEALLSSMLVG